METGIISPGKLKNSYHLIQQPPQIDIDTKDRNQLTEEMSAQPVFGSSTHWRKSMQTHKRDIS